MMTQNMAFLPKYRLQMGLLKSCAADFQTNDAVYLIYGKLVHSVFQSFLILNMKGSNGTITNNDILSKTIDHIVYHLIHQFNLYAEAFLNDINLLDIYKRLKKRLGNFVNWPKLYVNECNNENNLYPFLTLNPAATEVEKKVFERKKYNNHCQTTPDNKNEIIDGGVDGSTKPPLAFYLKGIKCCEKYYESDVYGLKGIIDLVLNVYPPTKGSEENSDIYYPLIVELKTGKSSFSIEHKGQVMLYLLLQNGTVPSSLTSVVGTEVEEGKSDVSPLFDTGMLLYLDHDDPCTQRTPNTLKRGLVHSKAKHLKGMLDIRNELVCALKKFDNFSELSVDIEDASAIPDPINDTYVCRQCPNSFTCSLLGKGLLVAATPKSSSKKLITATNTNGQFETTNLDPLFFEDGEEGFDEFFKLDIPKASKYSSAILSFWDKILGQCDLSQEELSYFATWFRIIHMEYSHRCSTSNNNNNDLQHGFSSHQIKKESFSGVVGGTLVPKHKVDISTLAYLGLGNLIQLMKPDTIFATVRDLLFRGRNLTTSNKEYESRFNENSKINLPFISELCQSKKLNPQQVQIIESVLDIGKRYILVKGYPGTGKTETIIAVIRILHKIGASVLLTSHTNSAIDNILCVLTDFDIPFVRFGPKRSENYSTSFENFVNKQLGIVSTDKLASNYDYSHLKRVNEVAGNFFTQHLVFATTCTNATKDPMVSKLIYDFCIIDEASQISQPLCLGPLFLASRTLMVGDVNQLPPIVVSPNARELGAERSLFEALLDKYDHKEIPSTISIIELTLQYRMNSELVKLCNELVYKNNLLCATESVANAYFNLHSQSIAGRIVKNPKMNYDRVRPIGEEEDSVLLIDKWIERSLSPTLEDSIVFIDVVTGKHSEIEAIIVLLTHLRNEKYDLRNLGIISPFNRQIDDLQTKLGELNMNDIVECSTIDRFQGKGKDVILFSFALSTTVQENFNPEQRQEGKESSSRRVRILNDIRRLNVSVTRAKHKLIVFADKNRLYTEYPRIKQLFEACIHPHNIISLSS